MYPSVGGSKVVQVRLPQHKLLSPAVDTKPSHDSVTSFVTNVTATTKNKEIATAQMHQRFSIMKPDFLNALLEPQDDDKHILIIHYSCNHNVTTLSRSYSLPAGTSHMRG